MAEDHTMVSRTYLILMDLTTTGSSQDQPWDQVGARLGAWIEGHEQCDLLSYYATLGPHDFAAVVRVPDDEQALQLALDLAEQGYVRTTTMRAFDLQARELGALGPFK